MVMIARMMMALSLLAVVATTGGAGRVQAAAPVPGPSVRKWLRLGIASPALPGLHVSTATVYPLAHVSDLQNYNLAGSGEVDEYGNDGFAGGLLEVIALPHINNEQHHVDIETDVFFTDAGAQQAYGWASDLSGWKQSEPTAAALQATNPWFTGLTLTHSRGTPQQQLQAFGFARDGNMLVTVLAWTAAKGKRAFVQLRKDLNVAELASYGHIAHLLAKHAYSNMAAPKTTETMGTNTLWRVTLDRCLTVQRLSGSYSSADAQGKFVIAFLTVRNQSKSPNSFASDVDVSVEDNQGRTFSENSDAETAAADQYNITTPGFDDIQPTFSAHVVLAFDVARDATGLALLVKPAFSTSEAQVLYPLCS